MGERARRFYVDQMELPVTENGDGPDPTDVTGIGIDPSTAEAPNMTCIDGVCQSEDLPAENMPVYDGQIPRL